MRKEEEEEEESGAGGVVQVRSPSSVGALDVARNEASSRRAT
jgi:hypothetical protein